MVDFPLLSLVTFLPLVGAAFILVIRGDEALVARNARNVALWTTLINFVLSLLLWIKFDNTTANFQFVEQAGWLTETINYKMGVDGISMLFIILATFLMPIAILASWESIKTRVKEYMIAFLILETTMIGVFSALDFVVFYLFFEGGFDPDVPHHRCLGRQESRLRNVQILPVHVAGFGPDVARHHHYVLQGRHHRHSHPDEHGVRSGIAEVAVDRLFCILRGEGSDVAVSYLAAGCPCRGADGRLSLACGRAPEDGRLWVPAVFDPHAARRHGVLYALHIRHQRNCHRLCVASRDDAARHEKTCGLFLSGAHGFL